MSRFSRWQLLFAASGGLFIVVGWQQLPAPPAALLLAVGGGLLGIALAPRLWRRSSPERRGDAQRLGATVAAFQEGMLELYSLVELGRTISASLDLDQLFTTTMKRVAETTGVERFALFLSDETDGKLVARAVSGIGTEPLQNQSFALGEGLAGRVFQSRTPEAHSSSGPLPWPDLPPDARSVVAVPLLSADRGLGVLMLYSPVPRAFDERQTEETFDDHFKTYNDSQGHHQGDYVLREVTARLMENTRQVDVVARFGGEEFVVILPMTTKTHARLVAEKLRRSVEETKIPGEEILPGGRLTISLGLAAFPDDASERSALVQAADAALYSAKRKGRNRTEVTGRP